MNPKISQDHLQRRAIVYVRQSTATQLQQNRESQIRQYGLAIHARDFRVYRGGNDR
jgi:DNA invertase Pin-like site-specific DNA recombinase